MGKGEKEEKGKEEERKIDQKRREEKRGRGRGLEEWDRKNRGR